MKFITSKVNLSFSNSQVYGMSESSGGHTMNIISAFQLNCVGRTLPGMQTMLYDKDEKGNGEVMMNSA
jgi:long-subunit acyl-CoA synthetase (AMP-forming)